MKFSFLGLIHLVIRFHSLLNLQRTQHLTGRLRTPLYTHLRRASYNDSDIARTYINDHPIPQSTPPPKTSLHATPRTLFTSLQRLNFSTSLGRFHSDETTPLPSFPSPFPRVHHFLIFRFNLHFQFHPTRSYKFSKDED
ncbi:BQ2448_1015 [Microbotryum intermedium]|uniref:BQ2448_1015 protein n=1 Tax=Microbotryum intermedium TaxID=269621 RepID=A0A238FAJ1_9BASI|nr:BQ2448_1015 [Microbotryum intermedium]